MQMDIFDALYDDYKITKPIRLIELFAGYGSQAMALERMNIDFDHWKVVEFDKYAIKSYNAVHGTNFETSDITKVSAEDLSITDTDKYEYIMTYSFPCQDLSLAGNQKGMSKGSGTRSGLLWEVERLLDECNELPQVLLMENVPEVIGTKNLDDFTEWQLKLEKLGYSNYLKILNAKNYGIPQNRKRCFMLSVIGDYNYNFPKGWRLGKMLKDILEETVNDKYYINESIASTFVASKTDGDSIGFVDNRDYELNKRVDASETVGFTLRAKANERKILVEPSIKEVGHIERPSGKKHQSNTVYSDDGLARSLCSTDYKSPLAILQKPRGYNKGGIHEHCPPITSSNWQENNYLIENQSGGVIIPEATKKGYAIANDGDYVNIQHPNSETRRGRVGKGVAQTLLCNDQQGVVVKESISNEKQRFYEQAFETLNTNDVDNGDTIDAFNKKVNKTGICPTITTRPEGFKTAILPVQNLAIRKLTPRECGRLMGVSDADITKMESVNSNSQLYKQFGNSIVVDVLIKIFEQLF